MSMYGKRIDRMMETMQLPKTESKQLQASNSPTRRKEDEGASPKPSKRTLSVLDKHIHDSRFNSLFTLKLNDNERNGRSPIKGLTTVPDSFDGFKDELRHQGDMSFKTINQSRHERMKSDAITAN